MLFVKSKSENLPFVPPEKDIVLDILLVAGKDMSFDAIRKMLGKNLPDGTIHQIALDAGYKVEEL